MDWKHALDSLVARVPGVESAWTPLRASLLNSRYRRRRDRYYEKCADEGRWYTEAEVVRSLRERIEQRGYTVQARKIGTIHTFAFIPRVGWHPSLYDDLRILGPVSEYDYVSDGYAMGSIYRPGTAAALRRSEMNARFLSALERANRENPVDWVFVYASGIEVYPSTIREIAARTGIPTVNMCLDDKHSWVGPWTGEARAGQIDLAPVFDVSWTSARIACEWYLASGGRPLYLPEGCNVREFRPVDVPQDIAVSFLGARYGFRPKVIRFLRRRGIGVEAYGRGWKRGPWVGSPAELFSKSQINLGMGGIGYSQSLTNLKGRDFEITCTGGGVYVTSFNPDLALHFHVGREIVCYRSPEEMVELIRYYLAHADEAHDIAAAARQRCVREHRWIHRYVKVCQTLGLLDDSSPPATLVVAGDSSARAAG